MSEQVRPAPRPTPRRPTRLRGWVSLGMLLAFYVVGGLHEFAPELAAVVGLGR
ncbi:hypothetical protein [Actinomycetospora aeridis]|uniref:MFS transporter n=1 Tax=Actinomycetospora aeridis TaxID=3129231 RepID=A0ABU8NC64_9PSEU